MKWTAQQSTILSIEPMTNVLLHASVIRKIFHFIEKKKNLIDKYVYDSYSVFFSVSGRAQLLMQTMTYQAYNFCLILYIFSEKKYWTIR